MNYTDTSSATTTNAIITTGTGTTSTTYYPTGDYWWQPYIYPYWATWPPIYSCTSTGHEFMQAKPPMETVLFCRKCGETKQLNAKRSAKK